MSLDSHRRGHQHRSRIELSEFQSFHQGEKQFDPLIQYRNLVLHRIRCRHGPEESGPALTRRVAEQGTINVHGTLVARLKYSGPPGRIGLRADKDRSHILWAGGRDSVRVSPTEAHSVS